MVIALCYIINSIYYIAPLSNIAGMSLFTWIFFYVSSIVFKFCVYHQMFLWYILIDDVINITAFYLNISMELLRVLKGFSVSIGIVLFIILIVYVKYSKATPTKNYRRY